MNLAPGRQNDYLSRSLINIMFSYLACEKNKYGSNCEKDCNNRQCADNATTCDDAQFGTCVKGCQAGWTGADCTQSKYTQ